MEEVRPSFGRFELVANTLISKKGVFLQRLFSTFPNGWPGRGLLLQRVVIATVLFCTGFGHVKESSQFSLILPHLIGVGAGLLLLVGLWTPVCGTLVAIVEVWLAYFGARAGIPIMVATFGATLAMIGPGAWSIDAHLFGRKHFEISER
jgi:putative oxidoreductase